MGNNCFQPRYQRCTVDRLSVKDLIYDPKKVPSKAFPSTRARVPSPPSQSAASIGATMREKRRAHPAAKAPDAGGLRSCEFVSCKFVTKTSKLIGDLSFVRLSEKYHSLSSEELKWLFFLGTDISWQACDQTKLLNHDNDLKNISFHEGALSMSWIDKSSFWHPDFLERSAWAEHTPFVFWLVSILQPHLLVELGTHRGYSYFAFCQAAQKLGLRTHCHAVDTWKGDEHAGCYGEDVFRHVEDCNNTHYVAFSRLIRSTFDEALDQLADASFDLLRVDGRHYYEDLKHDFESWRPKLSDRAIVLFHDTQVRERDFGVFRLWEELSAGSPSFEFFHGHGLGAAASARDIGAQVRSSGCGNYRTRRSPVGRE